MGGVARPIAKRRVGLLGWVASPNGGINCLVLASGWCPVRFDLDHSLFSGLESKAAGQECPLYTNLGCFLCVLKLGDLDGCLREVGGNFEFSERGFEEILERGGLYIGVEHAPSGARGPFNTERLPQR